MNPLGVAHLTGSYKKKSDLFLAFLVMQLQLAPIKPVTSMALKF
jgi:hypothetical protein